MTLYACCIVVSFQIAILAWLFNFPVQSVHDSFTLMIAIIPILFGIIITELYLTRPMPDCLERQLREDHRDIYKSLLTIRSVLASLKKGIAEIRSRDVKLAALLDSGIDFDKAILKANERLESTVTTEGMVPHVVEEYRKIISKWQRLTFLSFALTMGLAVAGFFITSPVHILLGYGFFGATVS